MDPLLKKLNHRDGPVTVLGAPDEFGPTLAAWAEAGVTVRTTPAEAESFVLVFTADLAALDRLGPMAAAAVEGDGILWVAYPKKSSKRYRSDLTRDVDWAPLGAAGFEPVRQVAIDEDWSALRFRRVEHIANLTRSRSISEAGRKRLEEG